VSNGRDVTSAAVMTLLGFGRDRCEGAHDERTTEGDGRFMAHGYQPPDLDQSNARTMSNMAVLVRKYGKTLRRRRRRETGCQPWRTS